MDNNLQQLLERNLELTEKIAKDMKKIRHHFWLSSVWTAIKVLLLLAPIVGGYFYLKPYFAKLQSAYGQVLGIQKSVAGLQEDIGQLQQGVKNVGKAAEGVSSGALPEGIQLPSLESVLGLFGTKK